MSLEPNEQSIPAANLSEDERFEQAVAKSRKALELAASQPDAYVNIASHLPIIAQEQPYQKAVVVPAGRMPDGKAAYAHLTFKQLNDEADRIAHGLHSIGIGEGTKTILMVKPSLELFSLTFALFKVGATFIMIDPGMGVKRMVHCLKETQAEAFIGIPLAHVVRKVFPSAFRSVKKVVTVGKRLFWGGPTLEELKNVGTGPFETAKVKRTDMAAILFTTGSTGPAKGVVYQHGTFDAQVHYLRSHFRIRPGEVDLATFPLFALFGPALGMTAVIPDMDPRYPAKVDPVKLIETIEDHGCTTMFGSPALLNRVGRYAKANNIKLPSFRRVISAGAPVPHAVLDLFGELLNEGVEIHTPYGATESLPTASIGSKEILGDTRELSASGKGICVGQPMKYFNLRVIKISDDPIENWSDDLLVPAGEIGEIVVKGPTVTKSYFNKPDANAGAKIKDGDEVCHRMGDVGWLDDKGRVWFCGRKKHRVITADGPMFTVPCEAIFNQHPRVYRSALVGQGKAPNQTPAIIVELEAGDNGRDKAGLTKELLDMAQKHEQTAPIKKVLFHESLPVDIRHNAKIFREKLTVWAANK